MATLSGRDGGAPRGSSGRQPLASRRQSQTASRARFCTSSEDVTSLSQTCAFTPKVIPRSRNRGQSMRLTKSYTASPGRRRPPA